MLSTEQIDKIVKASTKEARDKLDRLKQDLEYLIASLSVEVTFKDVNSVAIQELQTTVAQINDIIIIINAENGNDSQTLKLKADGFLKIANLLKNISDRHHKLYSKYLLERLQFSAKWYEGLGKLYEIGYFTENEENTSSFNFESSLILGNLLADFLENFSENYLEETMLIVEYASSLGEIKKIELSVEQWLSLPKSTRESQLNQLSQELGYPVSEELYINARKAEERFIKVAKETLERIETSRKGSSLLPYMTNLGRTREEQIQKNQKALAYFQSKMDEEVSEEELQKSRKTWELVKKIIDEQRPPGQKLFSEE